MNAPAFRMPIPRMALTSLDRLRIDGRPFRVVSADRDGAVLANDDADGLHEGFTHEQLFDLLDADRLQIDKSFFSPGKAHLRLIHGGLKLSDLDQQEQRWVNYRHEWVRRFLKLEAAGGVSRSDPSMKPAIKQLYQDISGDGLNGKKRQCRQAEGARPVPLPPPSPSLLRRWLRRFERGDFDPTALINRHRRSGNRTPKMKAEVRHLINQRVPTYASNLRKTGKDIRQEIEAEIAILNAGRAETEQLQVPSLKTIYREIKKLDAFHVLAGRRGLEHARKKFFVVHEGVEPTRLLERVEMDEWMVSLSTLLVDTRAWANWTEEERKKVTKARCWITAAIDCASRCILALHLSVDAPSGSSAVAALRMILTDKTDLSKAAGASTPWFMRGVPEELVTDRGAAFISDYFRGTVSDLGVTHALAPAGLPQMRGTIERLFRTMELHLIAPFSGRTFADVRDRGDYESEEQASLMVDELVRVLPLFGTRYHNTPHEGLGGETPQAAWQRLSKECEVNPPPSPSQARHIFGIQTERRVGSRGIRFLGLHFQSVDVQRLRRDMNQKPVQIRVDPENLGEISVRIADDWVSAPCVEDFSQGLSVAHWTDACRRLRQRFADEAALARPAVLEFIAAIRATADAARERAGIASPVMSEEAFARAEHELFRTFRIRDGARAEALGTEDDILGIEDEAEEVSAVEETAFGNENDWNLEA